MVKIRKSNPLFSAVNFVFQAMATHKPDKDESFYKPYKWIVEIKQDTITATDSARLHHVKIKHWHGLKSGFYNVKRFSQNMFILSLSDNQSLYYPKYDFLFNKTYESNNCLVIKESWQLSIIVFKVASFTNTDVKCYNPDFFKPFIGDNWLAYIPANEMTFATFVSEDKTKYAFIMPIKM